MVSLAFSCFLCWGWCCGILVLVDEEVFTQPSIVEADMLPELHREMRCPASHYGVSEGSPVTAPVAASQLHLNGWGFLRTFERVCLHFGFRPSWRVFLYTYPLHAPPPRKGFMSFRAHQGRKLFDSFEEFIQEFKWHYFKVLPLPGKRPFWLDDEGTPFSWVYWNSEVGHYRITALHPLATLAFEFLQSLPVGLGKKSNFKYPFLGMFLGIFLPPEQLVRTAQYLVGIENASAAKVGLEKELAATKDQVDILMAERDSALAAPLLTAKIDSLTEELRLPEGGHLSASARMKEVEESAKVQAAELESCRSALEQEKKKVESYSQSLEQK
ncbi:hypothetical protein PIB30_068040 [Stylosanthes scabra]|uniref:Uncharacterized protein n=1 Tax=Stylosanthes scabra TaxID=79078 RepID=A0ABU6WL45_9FABA|nr:hypothetical protein [Stylosanthes scabra]